MGTPVVPGEKGDDCAFCTPGTWAPGHTPKYLLLMLSGMTKGVVWAPGDPEPPNGEHILTQHATNHCAWERYDPYFTYIYKLTATKSKLEIWDGFMLYAFFYEQLDPCWAYFHNAIQPPGLWRYGEGDAFIDLYDFPGTAYQLMHDYGLGPTDYTRFDVFHCNGEKPYVQVRRFGNVRTPTNIAIKTDATHKDQYEMFEA